MSPFMGGRHDHKLPGVKPRPQTKRSSKQFQWGTHMAMKWQLGSCTGLRVSCILDEL